MPSRRDTQGGLTIHGNTAKSKCPWILPWTQTPKAGRPFFQKLYTYTLAGIPEKRKIHSGVVATLQSQHRVPRDHTLDADPKSWDAYLPKVMCPYASRTSRKEENPLRGSGNLANSTPSTPGSYPGRRP